MRWRYTLVGLVLASASACSTPQSIEGRAEQHAAAAERLASGRHYEGAAREQHKADALRRQASRRLSEETFVMPPAADLR
jgi:hypothetical protein